MDLDLVPCRVTLPGGVVWDLCRVLVDHHGRAGIWRAANGQTIRIWAGHAVSIASNAPRGTPIAAGPWQIETADGPIVAVRTGGCQCALGGLLALGQRDLEAADVPA